MVANGLIASKRWWPFIAIYLTLLRRCPPIVSCWGWIRDLLGLFLSFPLLLFLRSSYFPPAALAAAQADCGLYVDRHAMLAAHSVARRLLDVGYHNRKVRPISFSIGDIVYFYDCGKPKPFAGN